MNAIYQARFNHYLHDRGLKDTSDQHVWAFSRPTVRWTSRRARLSHVGAGRPRQLTSWSTQSAAPRTSGARQRQDHSGTGVLLPGAGWNVIKVVWGREWTALLHADRDGALVNLMNTTPDGDYRPTGQRWCLRPRSLLQTVTRAPAVGREDVRPGDLLTQRGGHELRRSTPPTAPRRSTREPDGDPGQGPSRATRWGAHFPGPQRHPRN